MARRGPERVHDGADLGHHHLHPGGQKRHRRHGDAERHGHRDAGTSTAGASTTGTSTAGTSPRRTLRRCRAALDGRGSESDSGRP